MRRVTKGKAAGAKKKTSPPKKTAGKKVPAKKATAAAKASERKLAIPKTPGLVPLLDELRPMLARHSPPFEIRNNSPSGMDLWGPKVVLAGKDKPFFAGAMIQKGYIGFYFFPIYLEPERFRKTLAPELLALLKGKSCFYIKKLDPMLKRHIQAALELGARTYKEKGWI